MKPLYLLLLLAIPLTGISQSSITIAPADARSNKVETIVQSLQGEGLIIENITTNQPEQTNQVGGFEDTKFTLSMDRGLLMSTGSVTGITSGWNTSPGWTGPTMDFKYDTITVPCEEITTGAAKTRVQQAKDNGQVDTDAFSDFMAASDTTTAQSQTATWNPTPGEPCEYTYMTLAPGELNKYVHRSDPDLQKMLGTSTPVYDACVIELDFIPLGDTLSFRYIFGSDEYDEYVCSPFNDAFAFFLSGPGIKGIKNLAVLPNGDRVTVNSINNGNPAMLECAKSNPSFYNRNLGQIPLEYDGFTRTLDINYPVKPFETYHLKLVIADAGDNAYDSGVFIEGQSMHSYDRKYTIPFGSNVSELTPKTRKILDAMVQITEDHPEYVLQVTGHADGQGSEAYNLDLAQDRIDVVTNYIQDAGWPLHNVRTLNKGESMPIADNETEEGRATNRRVEVKLIPSWEVEEVMEEAEEIEFELDQNYPNPARQFTTIEGQLPASAINPTLRIADLTGTVFEETSFEPGRVEVNVSEWPSGIYIYSLIENGTVLTTKRMVVAH